MRKVNGKDIFRNFVMESRLHKNLMPLELSLDLMKQDH